MRKAKTLSLFTLSAKIPDEAAAVAFFEARRWDGKPTCPRCESTNTTPRPARMGHRCNLCRKDFTVRIGTLMECSKLPLRKWIFGIYLMMTARKGISALQLSKELDCTYRAAWFLEHRIRAACQAGDDLLTGTVEADECFVGGSEKARHESKKKDGGGGQGKSIVVGARERGGEVRAAVVPDRTARTLLGFLRDNVSCEASLMTDDAQIYGNADLHFLHHASVNHSEREYVRDLCHTNGIESVWAVLKRAIHGTFHQISDKHLGRYVDECAFRLGAGNVQRDTVDRLHSLSDGLVGRRLTYKRLTA